MEVSKKFEHWGRGFSGCDGGDIGDRNNRSIWVCGIEWGGGHTPEILLSEFEKDVTKPPLGYLDWKENLAYIFNWQIMKLLAVINGESIGDYKKFAEDAKPFVESNRGYFKMNLYPIAFKNTDHNRWCENFSLVTGLENKSQYITWNKEQRFPEIRKWAKIYHPKLIICLGKSYLNDFKSSFGDEEVEFSHEVIDGKDLFSCINNDGSIVVVIPFMVNRHGLNKNETISRFGKRIRELVSL